MFDLDSLLTHIAPPTRQPDNPREMVSRTIKGVSGTQPDTHPTYPTADGGDPSGVGFVGLLPGDPPDTQNTVLYRKNPEVAGCRVGDGVCACWHTLHAQVDTLAARLVELEAPRLRVDVDGLARGYRPLEGLGLEGVTCLLRETLEALARQWQYPAPREVAVIALWPGPPVKREVLAVVPLEAEEDSITI